MPASSAKTKHYYREGVRSVLVRHPMISGEGIRKHLEAQSPIIDRHYINKLVKEIHAERAKRANTWPDGVPMGWLVQASDGNLYGVTHYGEIYQSTLGGNFTTILPGIPFDTMRSGLTLASDGNLWGTHVGNGSTDSGDVFGLTLAGKQVQSVELTCTSTGGMPQGVIQGKDGKFYGVSTSCVDNSGVQHFGAVFVVDAGLSPPPGRP